MNLSRTNVTFKNAYYFIKGNIIYFLFGKILKDFIKRSKECQPCINNKYCINCGCHTEKMLLSGKPCQKYE